MMKVASALQHVWHGDGLRMVELVLNGRRNAFCCLAPCLRPAGIVSSFDLRIRHVSCREYGGSSYRHQELKESRPRQNFLAMVKIITLTVGLIVMRISRRKAQFDIGLTRHFYTLSSIKDLLNLRSYDVVQTRQNYILLTG